MQRMEVLLEGAEAFPKCRFQEAEKALKACRDRSSEFGIVAAEYAK